ncbi:hypothetical protein R3P38DRAFT_2801373 [Favolaschia claudopus]|uniref:F-box domain-containing protein n=1 Tax=Favolaschia claudopus TaxID=2862362 RepID=A0AAV9ZVH9_9AGAR
MVRPRAVSSMTSRVQTSPLFAMPVEVQALILLFVCGEFDDEPMAFVIARIEVCRICALWRNIVFSDSRFWSSVFIGDRRNLAILPLWISRSKSSPLHLFVDTGTYEDNWRYFDSVFASLVRIVPSIIGRITRFSLWDGYGDRGAVILHWLTSLAASNVQRLDIFAMLPTVADARVVERGRGRWGRRGRKVDLSKPSTPLHLIPSAPLVALVVHHAFLVLHPSMLSSLRCLRLGPIPSRHRLSWDSLRSMLLACPALTLFVCHEVCCEDGPFQECELPNLTHFRLVCRNSYGNGIFSALRLPSLRVLSLDEYTPGLWYGSETALASVEVLELTCGLIWPETLFHFLRPLLPASSREAVLALKQFMVSYLVVKNIGQPNDVPNDTLCPSLALVRLGGTLNPNEVADLLSLTPATAMHDIGRSFRVVNGVVEATEYALPAESPFQFGDGFCG